MADIMAHKEAVFHAADELEQAGRRMFDSMEQMVTDIHAADQDLSGDLQAEAERFRAVVDQTAHDMIANIHDGAEVLRTMATHIFHADFQGGQLMSQI